MLYALIYFLLITIMLLLYFANQFVEVKYTKKEVSIENRKESNTQ